MFYLFIVMALILIHGMFVSAEYAFVKTASSRNHLDCKRYQGQAVEHIWQNMEEYLLVCNIGKTLALMSMGICIGMTFGTMKVTFVGEAPNVNRGIMALVYLISGFTQIVIGFEIPKLLGITKSDRCVLALSSFLSLSRFLFYPIVWMIKRLTDLIR